MMLNNIFKNFSDEKVLVAHHEAGHVMGALLIGIGVKSCQIHLNSCGQWAGKTRYNYGLHQVSFDLIQEIIDGQKLFSANDREALFKAIILRYSIAIAGPLAELKYVKGLNLNDLESYLDGSDIGVCQDAIDFLKQHQLYRADLEKDLQKNIGKLFNQSHSWNALEKLAHEILTSTEHYLDKAEIEQVIKPKHLLFTDDL